MARRRTAPLSRTEAERLAALFKALGDPSRLLLLSWIAEGERCVHELAEQLDMEQSTVSHQLRVLRDRRLVRTRREGRHIYYALRDDHVRDVFALSLEHARET